MAGKITDLTAITTVTTDDLFEVVNDPGGSVASRKVTFDNLQKSITAIGTLTTDIVTASDKYLYLGAIDTDGTWRIRIASGNLVFEKRESGSYVEKGAVI